MAQAVLTEEKYDFAFERREYRTYIVLAFPFMLAATLLARMVRRVARSPKGRGTRPSLLTEARELTHSVVPWIFAGR